LILAGSRVAYAMAKDGLFFKSTGKLNEKGVPQTALLYQGIWIIVLILLRTRNADGTYGNLYSDLLDYVIFSALLFYVLTIGGIFLLRWKRPELQRPYKAFGYPVLPLLYIVAATGILVVLLLYKTANAGKGLALVLIGVPVYWLWHRRSRSAASQ
jgi:APA family basic amino acid/polyamine antiporter